MTDLPPAYADLLARHAELGALEECGAILSWDQSVTMPKGSAEARARRRLLAEEMTPQQIAEAHRLAAKWIAPH